MADYKLEMMKILKMGIKCENWKDNISKQEFEEYYRLWRGQWDPADSDESQSVPVLFLLHFNRQ